MINIILTIVGLVLQAVGTMTLITILGGYRIKQRGMTHSRPTTKEQIEFHKKCLQELGYITEHPITEPQ